METQQSAAVDAYSSNTAGASFSGGWLWWTICTAAGHGAASTSASTSAAAGWAEVAAVCAEVIERDVVGG